MSNKPKNPIEPLRTLKGVGYAGPRNTEQPRPASDGGKALVALDKMITDSMRRDGLLSPSPKQSEPPASTVPVTAPMPDIADYDAMQMPVWTLVMALAWIATRSAESVTWQRADWRREHGWPEASVPTSLDPDPDDPHPAFYSSAAAMNVLKSKGEAGELEVRAMSVARNQPVVLTPLDWSYGALQFNRRFDEVWVVGRDEYVRLTVQRDNLLKVFPPKSETPVLAPVVADAAKPVPEDEAPRKPGRPKGATNWDAEPFVTEMVRRLVAHGSPDPAREGWSSWDAAGASILEHYMASKRSGDREPSQSTVDRWVSDARARWASMAPVQEPQKL